MTKQSSVSGNGYAASSECSSVSDPLTFEAGR